MPLTARPNISSETMKALFKGRLGATSKSLSFGITITVSELFCNFSKPLSAFSLLLIPSAENGIVATATVKAPDFLANLDIIGAEPVPVPPPRPQVTNTISEPFNSSLISSSLSSAHSSPTVGSPPAPRPPQVFLPKSNFLSA